MTITAWRIVRDIYLSGSFSGDGAKKGGGRWSSIGTAMVYTAGSLSLATLEALAHLPSYKLLKMYKCVPISFDKNFVIKPSVLPSGWDIIPPGAASKFFGDQWVQDAQSAILEVPSTIIPGESNFLLNPNHLDFQKMIIGEQLDFPYDSRFEE